MDNNRKAVWICKCECGNTKALRTNDLVSHRVHSCGCLAESLGELKIAEILQQQGMEYVKQYVFDDCKNSRGLRFDFAVIENDKVKYLIEYDGQQHFAPMGYWGGKERLVSLQTNDKIKNEYCEKNNIPLIRIPYTVKPHLITLEMLVV